MSISRKHFVAIAEQFAAEREQVKQGGYILHREAMHIALDNLAERLANVLVDFNPSFHRGEFLDACGYGVDNWDK